MKNIERECYFFCKNCKNNNIWTDKETGITFLYCKKGATFYENRKNCTKLHKHLVKILGIKKYR